MDYTLQVRGAKYVFPIPDGLKELSSDIVREVLRHQPEHINGFIADYLEAMLVIREKARDAAAVVCDVLQEGHFYDDLFRYKSISREQANAFVAIIQAAWRGYVVRRKLALWLKKKKKAEEEKEARMSMRIEELLEDLGITYEEATRAAGIIQTAFREKKSTPMATELGETTEMVPFGQRVREADRVGGRYDRWDKTDFGDFFELDESGDIKYNWPKVGQLRRVRRDELPVNTELVEFFAMRDLEGREQYSYLIKTRPGVDVRGIPIGFLIPLPKSGLVESAFEVEFVNPENAYKMGHYTYIFQDDVRKEDLEKFNELLKEELKAPMMAEIPGEFDYDPHWVLPRVLVRIRKELLLPTDDEVKFVSLPENVVCEKETFVFRAESLKETAKVIRYILRENCLSVEEGLLEAGNLTPYKVQETGRIIPVDAFTRPEFIQRIIIEPETSTGEEESDDLKYEYIFLPVRELRKKKLDKGEPVMRIPISRFQGYHTDYEGSNGLENKVFILGPRVNSPDGKPFTFESLFWEEFGEEAWYQLLHSLAPKEEVADEETETAIFEEEEEEEQQQEEEEKQEDEIILDSQSTKTVAADEVKGQEHEPEEKTEPSKKRVAYSEDSGTYRVPSEAPTKDASSLDEVPSRVVETQPRGSEPSNARTASQETQDDFKIKEEPQGKEEHPPKDRSSSIRFAEATKEERSDAVISDSESVRQNRLSIKSDKSGNVSIDEEN